MAKSLCKWSRTEREEEFSQLVEIIKKPKFICARCARAARKKGFLCKPAKLKV